MAISVIVNTYWMWLIIKVAIKALKPFLLQQKPAFEKPVKEGY